MTTEVIAVTPEELYIQMMNLQEDFEALTEELCSLKSILKDQDVELIKMDEKIKDNHTELTDKIEGVEEIADNADDRADRADDRGVDNESNIEDLQSEIEDLKSSFNSLESDVSDIILTGNG